MTEPIETEAPRQWVWGGGRRWAGVILLGLVVLALGLRRLAWAPDDEMAPSILRGDLLVILPVEPRVGDVVAITDPLEPSRWTLRRVIAGPGQTVRFEDAAFVVGDEPKERLEMGRADGMVIVQDGASTPGAHLARIRTTTTRWEMAPVALEEGRWFLGADALDEAMDGRWWGPAPRELIAGVVMLRVGEPQHPWRGWVTTTP